MLTLNQTKITANPGKQELFITHECDAPRNLVFKAYTDPNLIQQWIGPRGYDMKIEKFESKPGGTYRYIHTDPQGKKHGFHGVIHDIIPDESIIQTFEYEGLPEKGHVTLDIAKFESLPGNRTRITAQSVFMSTADRDGMMQADMEKGVQESYERLDELLASGKVK